MVYSEVINNGWHLLLPKKSKYTKEDYLTLLNNAKQFSPKDAFFIVKCTAIFHDVEYSDFFNDVTNILFC